LDGENVAPNQKMSSVDEAFWMGFTDELQKIAAATGVADVTKAVKKIPTGLPKLTSKPVIKEPSAAQDFFSSSKTISPPPVTAAGN
jgi:hypothetical protein